MVEHSVLSMVTVFYHYSTKSNLAKFVIRESLPFAFDSTQIAEDYGIDSRGIFFVHERMLDGCNTQDDVLLIVLPEKTAHADRWVEETGEKYYYRMAKVGNYYAARTRKVFTPAMFYFQSGSICFPTFNQEKFSPEDLLQNHWGGYVLKSN